MGGKSKLCFSPVDTTGTPHESQGGGTGYKLGSLTERVIDSTERGGVRSPLDVPSDSLYRSSEPDDRTQGCISCLGLGPLVKLDSILLLFECDLNLMSFGKKIWVELVKLGSVLGEEFDAF